MDDLDIIADVLRFLASKQSSFRSIRSRLSRDMKCCDYGPLKSSRLLWRELKIKQSRN